MYGLTEKNCQNLTQSWQAKGTYRCDGYWGKNMQEKSIESSTNIDRKARKHNSYRVMYNNRTKKKYDGKKSKITKNGGNL